MKQIIIPSDFVLGRTRLSWAEARYGWDHGWFDAESICALAINALEEKAENDPLEARLAGLRDDEMWALPDLVEKLAHAEPESSLEQLKKKWLCLILAWLYESRTEFGDPFDLIDEIYANFDYPEEIKGLVSYMPVSESTSTPPYNSETPKERMLRLWKEYVETCNSKPEETL